MKIVFLPELKLLKNQINLLNMILNLTLIVDEVMKNPFSKLQDGTNVVKINHQHILMCI